MEAEKSEVKLTVENRKTLLMDGVIHVIGFDEDYGGEFDTEEEAIAAWNGRVESDV